MLIWAAPIPADIWPETLYQRDDALLYIAYVMLIWAAPIPVDIGPETLHQRDDALLYIAYM